ncbi:MAG: MerR family transcriptional regulator [Chloroflexota bacterium]
MDGYRISEAARETGFSASALRFYEQQGIVVPERTDNGYRSYDERAMGALRFIARAKRLGLSLEETAELLALLDEDECGPIQSRMRSMVSQRIDQAHEQVTDLVSFTAELQRVAARLGTHTPHGPCDGTCGCTADQPATALPVMNSVPRAGPGNEHIACSLEPGSVDGRITEWRYLLGNATAREELNDGVRLRFPRDADVVALSRLAAAEQGCCGFFAFRISIDAEAVTFEITGPPEAQDIIAAFARAA